MNFHKLPKTWIRMPISPTCEALEEPGVHCPNATDFATVVSKFGWFALCKGCAENHLPYCVPVEKLIEKGESREMEHFQ